MNYIGSKHRLSDFIKTTILNTVGDVRLLTLADLFGGTGAVARSFKADVRRIIINDIEPYSYALARNYIGNHRAFPHQEMLEELNALPPTEGFVYTHYCPGGGHGRQYFSDDNGRRIDAIRQRIGAWRASGTVDDDRYYFLLASLLESADKVANTASVYAAFLKHIKPTAQRPLTLAPAMFAEHPHPHTVHNRDANELIGDLSGDILYLDPPYNTRQYGANYHLLNTIALYDTFVPRGKTGLRPYQRSPYCQPDRVRAAFDDLLRRADFRYVFVSYNNEGLMSAAQVRETMSRYGRYDLATVGYQRFKADKDANRVHAAAATVEYLHILEK